MTTQVPGGGGGHTAYEGMPRPAWMARIHDFGAQQHEWFDRFRPPPETVRRSAVLMLFAPGARGGEDVILTERAHTLRSHPGQVSFPGGTIDADDADACAAALRETYEEVGIEPASVDVALALPQLYLSPSSNAVTPVLGWWPNPGPVYAVDPAEVARADRVWVPALLDPDNRFTVTHPAGYRGPGFSVDGLFIWGFTAMLLSVLFDAADLTRPWDEGREQPLPEFYTRGWR